MVLLFLVGQFNGNNQEIADPREKTWAYQYHDSGPVLWAASSEQFFSSFQSAPAVSRRFAD